MHKLAIGAAVVCLTGAAPLSAQVAWDGPLLVGTESPAGWGAYLVDVTSDPGIGFLASWRGTGRTGYRIGLAEDGSEDFSLYGGADFSGGLVSATDSFPLDVSWVGGAGAAIGDDLLLSFPLGVSIGRDFPTDGVSFRPYMTPRVVFDAIVGRGGRSGGDAGRDEADLGLAFDLGLDVILDSGWAVRFGVSVADREAIAIGASFRID